MPRAQRIRIVIGLCVVVGGLALTVVGPLFAMTSWPEDPLTADTTWQYLDAMYRSTRLANVICFAGLIAAAMGAYDVFVTWARWFVGPRERSDA